MTREVPAGPLSLIFLIGDVCNAECIMCWQAKRRATTPRDSWWKEMPAKVVLDVVSRHLDTVKTVELVSFGEPMINPEFNQMVSGIERLSVERGCPILLHLITNGSLLHRYASHIMRLPGEMTISVDAPEKALYERIRVGLDWGRLLENIRLVVGYKERHPSRRVGINFAVFEDNVSSTWCMGHFATMEGFEYLSVLHGALLEGTDAVGREIRRDDSRLAAQIEAIRQDFPRLHLNDYATGSHSAPARAADPVACSRPWGQYDVAPDGHVHPCCRSYGTDLGHYLESPWTGDAMQTLRAQILAGDVDPVRFAECARCEYLGTRVRPARSLPVVP